MSDHPFEKTSICLCFPDTQPPPPSLGRLLYLWVLGFWWMALSQLLPFDKLIVPHPHYMPDHPDQSHSSFYLYKLGFQYLIHGSLCMSSREKRKSKVLISLSQGRKKGLLGQSGDLEWGATLPKWPFLKSRFIALYHHHRACPNGIVRAKVMVASEQRNITRSAGQKTRNARVQRRDSAWKKRGTQSR